MFPGQIRDKRSHRISFGREDTFGSLSFSDNGARGIFMFMKDTLEIFLQTLSMGVPRRYIRKEYKGKEAGV